MSEERKRPPAGEPRGEKTAGGLSDIDSNASGLVSVKSGTLMTRRDWEVYLHGYEFGFADGIGEGRRQAEEDIASLQRSAAKVVHSLARIPPQDRAADSARARRREARWSR